MKTKWFIPALILGFISLSGFTGETPLPKKVNNTFQNGEVLEYRVHYGLITAGTARLMVLPEMETVRGRTCYHVVGEGISAGAFDPFFKVRDKYETYIDAEAMVPWKFKRKIEEGGFKHYSEVEFDQTHLKAYENIKGNVTAYDVPSGIQDVVSAFYYARTMDFSTAKPGDVFHFENFIDKKVHNLDVKFIGREEIKVDGVRYNTVKIEPLLMEGGVFQHKGDMFIWISEDDNRIPIRVESGLVIGSVKIDLQRYQGLKHPMKSRIR